MTSDPNVSIVKRALEEVWSGKNPAALEEIYAPNYRRHDAFAPGIVGHSGIREMVNIYRAGIPDLALELDPESVFAAGDRVAGRYWLQGVQSAPLLSIPATGRGFVIVGIGIWRIQGGQLAEDWHCYDTTTFFQALGILPCFGEFLEKK